MQAEIIKMVAMSPERLMQETILVRCEDCIHAENCDWRRVDVPGWFCADGERRTEE